MPPTHPPARPPARSPTHPRVHQATIPWPRPPPRPALPRAPGGATGARARGGWCPCVSPCKAAEATEGGDLAPPPPPLPRGRAAARFRGPEGPRGGRRARGGGPSAH